MPTITPTPSDRLQTETYWRTHIERCGAGKLSQPKYCAQEGIKYTAFTYWKNRLSSRSLSAQANKFVSVQIAPGKTEKSEAPLSIQIKLLSGNVIYIPANLELTKMVALIQCLSSPHA